MFVSATVVAALVIGAAATGDYNHCPKYHDVHVLTDTAEDAEGLKRVVEEFTRKIADGGENNMVEPGPIKDGFRSINWDAEVVPFIMPGTFFEENSPRGARFVTDDDLSLFGVSNPVRGVTEVDEANEDDDRFDTLVGKEQAAEFVRFSAERLFTPLNTNEMRAVFSVPGSAEIKATTNGFGAVFTDVRLEGLTTLTFIDPAGCIIAVVEVPPKDAGLSFAGIVLPHPDIAQVDFVLGDTAVPAEPKDSDRDYDDKKHDDNKDVDIVVMDDFFYGEPQPLLFTYDKHDDTDDKDKKDY